ncbi:MAG: hypothetical protein JWN40_3242 [Phycisphaerales bacterium]|nr:hypothetical protein [Phycisphaerales bacterium]
MPNRPHRRASILIASALFLTLLTLPLFAANRAPKDVPAGMEAYQSPYYDLYSDLEPERVQEALLRMTRMAEVYHDRTKEFSGVIRNKFPFYLFKSPADYYAAGGLPGSAGVFMVRGGEAKLMAIAGEKSTNTTWHIVQHEGFHQFAHAVIGGELPPWLNEGLAEYFGEGIYTGDGMVTGVIPPNRCKRVQDEITNKRFKSIKNMMLLSHAQWNAEMDGTNYDMAWSMAHFLAHGDNGKYQSAFSSFVRDLGRNRPWDKAWEANFGSAEGFEKKWGDWWLAQDPYVTKDLYVKAAVSTMASYIGRAATQKQTFDNLEEFTKNAKEGTIKIAQDDWLPPTLITAMLDLKDKLGKEIKYELGKDPKTPQVIATLPDETRLVASYNRAIRTGPDRVIVTIDDLAPKIEKVKELLAAKKKADAKAMLQDAIKRNPKSPKVEEARKLLTQTL